MSGDEAKASFPLIDLLRRRRELHIDEVIELLASLPRQLDDDKTLQEVSLLRNMHVVFDAATETDRTADGDVWWSWFAAASSNGTPLQRVPAVNWDGGDTFNSRVMKRTHAFYDNHFEAYIHMDSPWDYWSFAQVIWHGHC